MAIPVKSITEPDRTDHRRSEAAREFDYLVGVPKSGSFEIDHEISSLVSVFATGPRAVGFTIVLGRRVVTMQMTTSSCAKTRPFCNRP